MEIRPDGYGEVLILDDGRRVPISAKETEDLILREVPRLTQDRLMTAELLASLDTDDQAVQDYLEHQGATITWGEK